MASVVRTFSRKSLTRFTAYCSISEPDRENLFRDFLTWFPDMPLLFGSASGRSFSGFNAQTSFSRAGANALRIACVVVLAIACCAGIPLAAQTAHVGGTIPIGGSGFLSPQGVAVDGNGNVFVADSRNNAVMEIVAVGGVVSSSSTVKTIGSGFSSP
jgi:hypothetical protein